MFSCYFKVWPTSTSVLLCKNSSGSKFDWWNFDISIFDIHHCMADSKQVNLTLYIHSIIVLILKILAFHWYMALMGVRALWCQIHIGCLKISLEGCHLVPWLNNSTVNVTFTLTKRCLKTCIVILNLWDFLCPFFLQLSSCHNLQFYLPPV